MLDEYKLKNDAVTAYRKFYLGEKMKLAKWPKRETPFWVT
jgi:hypothetical protein